MTTVAKGAAFALGVLLFFAEELLLGYLAATTVPKSYFDFFGAHKVAALIVEEAVLVAFPAGLLAFGWGLATTKLIQRAPYRVASWAIAGLLVTWVGRQLQGLVDLQSDGLPGQYPFATLLLSLLVPPVWGALTSVSAPLGVLLAGVVANRSDPSCRQAAALPLT